MKRLIIYLAACAMMTAVTSCEYDSPEIKFQQTTTITNDYSEVVDALRDQTLTISQKLNLIEEAMKKQTLTLSEKLSLLEEALKYQTLTLSEKMDLMAKAYENGVLKYEEMTSKLINEIKTANTTTAEKLEAVKSAITMQTTDLNAKIELIEKALALIADTAEKGFNKNAAASELVKAAIESLKGSLEEKLTAINRVISSQSTTLSEKLDLIKGSVDAGLVGKDSTLELVKKAIETLNSTTATANEKLEAIKNAINSPTSDINVKLEAIKEAVAQGVVDINEKQDLILKAVNSLSSHSFTKDELLEVGDEYLLVDAPFWNANHQNYEVVRALKDLIPLSLPTKYKFYYKKESGMYPLSNYEDTSFYGPLWKNGGILHNITDASELILAIDILHGNTAPHYRTRNGHQCYYLKKVYKSCYYNFHVNIGKQFELQDKALKVESMKEGDTFTQESNYIEYKYWSEAKNASTGVFGFEELEYNPNSYPNYSVQIILVDN